MKARLERLDASIEESLSKYPSLLPVFGYKELEKPNPNPFRYRTKEEIEQDAFNKCFSGLISITLSLLYLFPIGYYEICDMHINAVFYIIALASTILNLMTSIKYLQHYSKYVISLLDRYCNNLKYNFYKYQ